MSAQGALFVLSHPSIRVKSAWLAALLLLGGACTQPETAAPAEEPTRELTTAARAEDSVAATPVALALEVEDGAGVPLKLKAGQPFYVNIIDIRASVTATRDEGLDGLRKAGDFSSLPWGGTKLIEQEPVLLANADGTYTRRRFYRQAQWMNVPSTFSVQPVDAKGRPTGRTIVLNIGTDDQLRDNDDFFIRRLRGIQWTNDCKSLTDCSGAKNFLEEGLVEVRNARTANLQSFTLSADTTALKVNWSLHAGCPDYTIPVEQVKNPTYAYGVSAEVKALTPPRYNGTYAAGSRITFQVTLRDGAGNRLHPQGSLPTYNEVIFGQNEPGIQYYRAFFDPTATYYRRKHRERNMMTQIIGPAQRIQPIRTVIELDAFLGPDDVQTVGTLERDGVYSQFQLFPPANDLFGGAFDPAHKGWDAPVSDTWTYTLPSNAEPGTYLVTLKGRRVYLGQDIPYTTTVSIQVESPKPTSATLTTGPCNTCHSNGGELSKVLHANDNRAACAGCHAPLGFELEGPIFVRTHFLHSRSNRFDAPKDQCNTCHLTADGIQRTSKAACLSCHTSYPASHVAWFGPIQSIYVGGGEESFQQCTGSCHKTHPNSGL